jgi:excisionase family DNA binding protein
VSTTAATKADAHNAEHRINCEDCHRTLFSKYPEVMSIEQVSEALGVCPNSVRKLIYEHELPAKKVNYKWRVLRQDLQEWMLTK